MPARLFHVRRCLVTIGLALAVIPIEAQSQFIAGFDVPQGTALRVTVRDGPPRETSFAYVSPSALHVRERCDSCAGVLALPWSDVTRVDAQVAGPPSARRVLAGGLVGASATVVTLAIVLASGGSRCDWDGGSCPTIGIVITAPFIVLAGTGLGMLVGSQKRDRRWVTIR